MKDIDINIMLLDYHWTTSGLILYNIHYDDLTMPFLVISTEQGIIS